MKMVMLFLDMLRPDLLHICNESVPSTPLDVTLQTFGGTVFKNCYSPAPDTPRSSACLYSGCYPKRNGCDIRIKYPAFFLKNPETSLFTLLKNAGYSFNFFLVNTAKKSGMLPPGFENIGFHSKDDHLYSFLNNIVSNNLITDNSMTFIHLNDFHYMIDDGHGSDKAKIFLNDLIKNIDKIINIHSFDLSIIFSDHGFLNEIEYQSLKTESKIVKNRTQVYFQLINRTNKISSDKTIVKDERLCSVMDFYPTILDIADIKYSNDIDGISLLRDGKIHDYILLEDHNTFDTAINMTLDSWGVIDDEGLNTIGIDGKWEKEFINKNKYSLYEELIKEKMSFYQENRTRYQILMSSKELANYSCFSDGTPRETLYRKTKNSAKPIKKNYFFAVIRRIKKAIKVLIYG